MPKLFIVALFLLLAVGQALSQDTASVFLVGAGCGIHQSFRTYDFPMTSFQTNSVRGFEAGLDLFYKPKGKFGLLGGLSFLQTKSAITVYERFSDAEVIETGNWLTAGANIVFFPFSKSSVLPFFGTGMQLAFLNSSDVSVKITMDQMKVSLKARSR